MKFPTLTRLPSHNRFSYEPRYYDPVKEDIENRTERIRHELGMGDSTEGYKTRIKGSFRTHKKSKDFTPLIRLVIAIVLMGIIFGYIYLGGAVFNTSMLVILIGTVGVFLFLRISPRKRRFGKEKKFIK